MATQAEKDQAVSFMEQLLIQGGADPEVARKGAIELVERSAGPAGPDDDDNPSEDMDA